MSENDGGGPDDAGRHDGDPTEEVSAEECEPGADEAEHEAGALDETANATFPKFMDEVADTYVPEPGMMVPSPIDGLPIPVGESAEVMAAPPFTIDHVVCVEDDREYVEVFQGEDAITVGYLAMAIRESHTPEGVRKIRFHFTPDRVLERWDCKLVELTEMELLSLKEHRGGVKLFGDDGGPYFMLVRPARERCKHYARQILSHDGQPDPTEPGHRIIFRNCMIRRSVGGAFMGLRDEAVYACDYRDPPDRSSVKKFLDDPDHERLRSDAYKTKLPLFKQG